VENTSRTTRLRRFGSIAAAAFLIVFGVAAVVQGVDGRSTVRNALQDEKIVGMPYMTPAAMEAKAKEAGVSGLAVPDCSIAGKPVDDGAGARCFAEYMRADALTITGGSTYSELPRFATEDGKGTNDPAQAQQGPNGRPVDNPARGVWVTETALSTALNTSYMAEQISLFGIAVGAAFLLVGLGFAAVALAGVRVPSLASARRPAPEGAAS
jgi:hypothetical protein